MHPTHRSCLVLAIVCGVVAGMLGWQHQTTAALRGKIDLQHAEARELTRLQAENQRLSAAQPTEDELADLLARQITLEQLRSLHIALRHRDEAMARDVPSEPAVPSLKGNSVGYKLWRNVGQATPAAAFETALWAAAAGDLDVLAGLLVFDSEAQKQATEAFDHLPATMQDELGTPDKLIALLTAMDVPLGRASILGEVTTPAGTKVSSQLIDAKGNSKVALFNLQPDGERWRLSVPASVVARYDRWLQAAASASTVLR